jgi:hypothetical protein
MCSACSQIPVVGVERRLSVVARSFHSMSRPAECRMLLRIFEPNRADTFRSRMKRTKSEGYLSGSREAKLFKLAVSGAFVREQALDWLSNIIDEGARGASTPACVRAGSRSVGYVLPNCVFDGDSIASVSVCGAQP